MISVMNVVTGPDENAEDFAEAFSSRERLLGEAAGFRGFELLRRNLEGESAGKVEFLVISRWEGQDAFQAKIRNDLFKQAHAGDGQRNFNGHSEVRRFEALDVEVPA